MNNWPRLALCAAGLSLSLAGSAWAGLKAVDPGPYTLATGRYPMWYQDHNNLSMELCQSRAASSRVPVSVPPSYMCTLLPEPGIYDDALPLVFPDNWPPEMFWFLAETEIPQVGNSGYELEVYVAGIEAAFASENPVDGDQQSFARIRIRASVPRTGTYVITHPYGVETVNVTTAGRRAINITRDIGIGAPGNFSGVLNGAIGPFLRGVGGPYTEINPDTSASETYIGDPNITERVTGSPFNTNYVEIKGPAGTISTDIFTVSGKVLDARKQTPAELERASYRRTAADGTRVEVFAKAPNNATLCFRETLALVPGTPASPCQFNLEPDDNGLFFANHLSNDAPPPVIVVTATDPTGATRPTALSRKLSDVVKVTTARYDWVNKRLRIEASSSDEVQVPDLVAQGYGRLSKSGTVQGLTVNDVAQPPSHVTIKSAAGGSDTEAVVVVGNAPVEPGSGVPVAQADVGSTRFDQPLTLNLLANDSAPNNDVPLSITDLTQPANGQGSVALTSSTSVLYTPPPVLTAPLTTTFTYRAQDSKGLKSAITTVTISVTPNQAPTAVNDSASTQGVALPINVLANDTDLEGNLPLTVAGVTQPGVGTVSTDGNQVTYTPPAVVLLPYTTTFTYTARDSAGLISAPATVTVQVTPRPIINENFTVTAATVTARAGGRFTWDISGTSSVILLNAVTVRVNTPTGPVTLGTTPVPLTGRWRLNVTSTTAIPTAGTTVTITTSQGTVRTVPVTVQ
ncbi:Ig-like domain-containing protein [Pseudomonas caricapapayae]|uniref:Ig-like domain-containing protein n=1 Tax=Pseudomonas caricapapayae TaxID=46678 RepID=A0ACC7LZ17_9PSED